MRIPYAPQEVTAILLPLLESIEHQYRKGQTAIIGLQGGPGTGKTTLGNFLAEKVRERGYSVISFSIDDFYETNEYRKRLRKKYPDNPFYYISRGMPGTHRVEYLKEVLAKLKAGQDCSLPVFDKSLQQAQGDIAARTIPVRGRQDFVLFEGWCLGIKPVSSPLLLKICQKYLIPLQKIDPSFRHHQVVLGFLKQYQPLWNYVDYLIMLKPDSSELHLKWRWQQERELRKKTGRGMTRVQVERFVLPYLPFTYLCYEKVKADVRLLINGKHEFYELVTGKI